MKRATVTLTDELADRLRLEAGRRHTSVSAVMRILVSEALGSAPEGKRRIPFAALIHDPALVRADDLEAEVDKEWADDIDRDRG